MHELADTDTDETIGFYVKDHVDKTSFAEEAGVDVENVEHTVFRNVPSGESPTGREIKEVDEVKPGAFEVTVGYTEPQ